MNFTWEMINGVSFIFIVIAHFGALVLVVFAPSILGKMTLHKFMVVALLILWLILISVLTIAGMIITDL